MYVVKKWAGFVQDLGCIKHNASDFALYDISCGDCD